MGEYVRDGRRVLLVVAGAVLLCLLLSSCKKRGPLTTTDSNAPVEVVIPEHGAYTGAFMDFGDAEDEVTIETI